MNRIQFFRKALLAAGASLLLLSGFAHAQGADSKPASALSEGEVRKIDKENKKLTLKHGPLANLDMPSMTMVFQVKEDAMLDQVQAGDKVRFQAEKIEGKFTVTRIEPAR